jgi:hypothetical protein
MGFGGTFDRHPVLLGGILIGLAFLAVDVVRDVVKGRKIIRRDLIVYLLIDVLVGLAVAWAIRSR